ncbi:PAS domain S-box-containing protein/diguanylate cyclase (GGDEF) domain-containing protein [Thermomonas hydrothermalis]|uniref:PAS domain S-box-containing protein/diguanylate cyclase (GGDEF) domain-containing protein n=2 Tax=Thermomonas hydrothermalis TaxID=213588 RepID=A0A1M4VJR5_9GAMM|nr:PAS domain S-box-containing protein/diguanylate cyclase (GGDEF) domain-containing protein [Thermomonas hydrothermalis]
MPWDDTQRAVLERRADVLDLVFRTPEREDQFDFSAPFGSTPVGIYVNRRLPGIHDLVSLQGMPVGVERGDACATRLRQAGVRRLHEYPTFRDMIRAAEAGDLGIFCAEENPANYYLYRAGIDDRFQRAFILYEGQFHHAVRKGERALLQQIAQGMARIPAQERAALAKKWLAPPDPLQRWLRLAWPVAAAILGLLALMALWIWSLRRSVRQRTRQLQERQSQLQAVFDASPDAMWIRDRDGHYRDCNARAQALLDQRHTESGSQRVLAEVDDARVFERGEPSTTMVAIPDADGRIHHHEIIKVPLRDAAGQVHGLLGVARDISERLQQETQLKLWAQAFERAAFSMAILDAKTLAVQMVNPAFARERGYRPDDMIGLPLEALHPLQPAHEAARIRAALAQGTHTLLETEHVTREGRRFPVQLDCSVLYDDTGQPHYVVMYVQDISQRKQADAELRLAAVAFETLEPMMVLDDAGRIQRVNTAFTLLTGFEIGDVVGTSPQTLFQPRQDDEAFERLWPRIQREAFWQGEQWIAVKRGSPRIVRLEITAVPDEHGATSHYLCAMTDLTGEREALARAEHLALFDPLTDLPNRNFFADRLLHTLSAPEVSAAALLLLDLDHFKRVNDLRGHSTGNQLLAFVAQRLRTLLGESAILGRFDGDTFAILLPCTASMPALDQHVLASAERIRQALHEPFWIDNTVPITLTASIGWTLLDPDIRHADDAIKQAELAMYAAKAAGRNQVIRFDASMADQLAEQEALARELLDALGREDGGLALHYQLQIDQEGRAIGAEALLRFTRPDGRMVTPDRFIPLAEENGLILPLGEWVLQRACQQLAAWAHAPLTCALSLAINVSARQFVQPGFVDDVRRALQESGANPARLELEITESSLLGDLDQIAERLMQLQALGIRISLDDFGTGYSSLAYLAKLPLDQLKIDRSFICHLPDDASNAAVAQTIIRMAHGLGLDVIAEGVETSSQRDFLVAHGCHGFQGYLFARPLPVAEFERLLREQYPLQ